MRRCTALLFACLAAVAAGAVWNPPAAGAASRLRVVTVAIVEGAASPEWLRDPSLAALVREGSAALLGTRAGSDETDPDQVRKAAYATLGAGARAPAVDVRGELAKALRRAGVGLEVDPGLRPFFGEGHEGSGEEVVRFLFLRGDTPQHLAAAGARVATERRALADGDVLITLSPFPSVSRQQERTYLGMVAQVGPRIPPGLLYSPSTRRAGLAALTDIGPHILELVGAEVPPGMTGRALGWEEDADASKHLLSLESGLVRAARSRVVVVRTLMIGSMSLLGLLAVLLASGLFDRRPRWRAPAAVAMCAPCALPLVLLIEPVLPGGSPAAIALRSALLAIVVAVVGVGFFGAVRGLATIGGFTSLAVLADLIAGSPLASRSPLSYLLAQGARFYGIGNEFMGVVIGGALVAAAAVIGRSGAKRPMPLGMAALLAGGIAVMAAPALGAKFGATLTAIPALGILIAHASGRRIDLRMGASIAAVTAAATAAVFGADRLRGEQARSHIGSAVQAAEGSVLGRKLAAARTLIAFSIWMKALLVFGGSVALLVWKRGDDVGRALQVRPAFAGAFKGGVVGIVAAVLFNDAGMTGAALIAMFLTAAMIALLLEQPPPPLREQAVRALGKSAAR